MSIDSAKTFFERVQSDETFRRTVGEKSSIEERMAFVKAAGFDFTNDELKSVQSELSDDDLDQVAGGSWGCGHTHESETFKNCETCMG